MRQLVAPTPFFATFQTVPRCSIPIRGSCAWQQCPARHVQGPDLGKIIQRVDHVALYSTERVCSRARSLHSAAKTHHYWAVHVGLHLQPHLQYVLELTPSSGNAQRLRITMSVSEIGDKCKYKTTTPRAMVAQPNRPPSRARGSWPIVPITATPHSTTTTTDLLRPALLTSVKFLFNLTTSSTSYLQTKKLAVHMDRATPLERLRRTQ